MGEGGNLHDCETAKEAKKAFVESRSRAKNLTKRASRSLAETKRMWNKEKKGVSRVWSERIEKSQRATLRTSKRGWSDEKSRPIKPTAKDR